MNLLLIRPTDKARQNFAARVADMDIKVYEGNNRDEVRELLESHTINMVLVFIDRVDSELLWIFGMIMDHDQLSVVALTENDDLDVHLKMKLRRSSGRKRNEFSFHK